MTPGMDKFRIAATASYDLRVPDENPDTDGDALVIEPLTFDELVVSLSGDLDDDSVELLRASKDDDALAREVAKQIGSTGGS
jgi:hypothetical protein